MDGPDRITGSPSGQESPVTTARILVCSVPKSGTYLVGAILDHLGISDTKLHIAKESLTFHCRGTQDEYRKRPDRFRINLPVEYSIPKILPSQFAVSHLPCDRQIVKACQGLKVIFLYRDLRDCAVSLMRFIADTGRDDCAYSEWIQAPDGPARMARFLDAYHWYFRDWVKPVLAWQGRADSINVQYESLMGDFGEASQFQSLASICEHVGIDRRSIDFEDVLDSVLNTKTITWSGKRTQREQYWSPEVEEQFRRFGGMELNRRLGYEANVGGVSARPRISVRNLFHAKVP